MSKNKENARNKAKKQLEVLVKPVQDQMHVMKLVMKTTDSFRYAHEDDYYNLPLFFIL